MTGPKALFHTKQSLKTHKRAAEVEGSQLPVSGG